MGEPADGLASASGAVKRVLVVDDDPILLRVHARALARGQFQVETAPNGDAAVKILERAPFDVILSDIDMPGMNGIRLLERVRTLDLDVPVILVTGAPSVETAIQAIERGALRYLVKPVELDVLVKSTDDAVRLCRLARAKRRAMALSGEHQRFMGDQAGLEASFARALESLHIAYQPIISWPQRTLFAYEALLRTHEPELPNPGALLDAAERLGRLHELGRMIRARAIEPLARLPAEITLFLNCHPIDLVDEDLFDAHSLLADRAGRVVLEITERASLEGLGDVRARAASLRKLGFRLALDDLGAGYAGLTTFALLEPDVVKLDMSLVRNLAGEPTKRALVRTMITMCKELGIVVVAEGVESAAEREELALAGCELMQGYFFARPGAAFPVPGF
jgi:EAL domain-containing protein (putative c-di-GMP-specific phosphodiesterase class I)/AmiR/NasT family two-component response regulator